MLGRRWRGRQETDDPFAEDSGSWDPQTESRDGYRRRVAEVARRTGELQIADGEVLAPDSPWQRHSEQLGALRLAVLRRDRGRAAQRLEQVAAVAPVEVDDALSRAQRAAAEAEASRAAAEQHTGAADALAESRASLPSFRQAHRFMLADTLVAAIAFVGADTLVLDLSLHLSLGGPVKHWLTAGFVAIGLWAYAHGAGWLWAVIVGPWPKRRVARVALALVVATVLLVPIPAFWLLQEFRNHGISLLAAADHVPVANPVFFLPVQVVLTAGAMLASTRWFLTGDERRLRRDEDILRTRAGQERRRADDARSRSDAALREADAARRATAAAKSDLVALRANADVEDQVEVEHRGLLRALHDTEYALALEAARAAGARADVARQDALEAARLADAAAARREAAAERRARARALLGSNRQVLLLAALATTTTALILVLVGVLLPLAGFVSVAAGLAVAVRLLLLRTAHLTRRLLALDADEPPVRQPHAPAVIAAPSANGLASSATETM